MKRTTASGNVSNRYSEGNPALNIPATVVGAEELNNIQEEIANTVEAAGITLDGADEDQLLEAINILIGQGGSAPANPNSPNVDVQINDNQVGALTITGLDFDGSSEVAVFVNYHVQRRDDAKNAHEAGQLIIYYDEENASWELTQETFTPDAQTQAVGVAFSVTATGEIQYTSSNYGGANYSGTFRGSIRKVLA